VERELELRRMLEAKEEQLLALTVQLQQRDDEVRRALSEVRGQCRLLSAVVCDSRAKPP
jgi:hypothetical protein